MISPRAAIAWATESTRKGMSSLAMQIRIRLWPSRVPVDSSLTKAVPRGRRAAQPAMNCGRGAAILGAEIVELPGKGAAAQGAGKAVQQAAVSGVPRYHAVRCHKVRSRDSGARRPAVRAPIDPASVRRQGWQGRYSTVIWPVMPKAVWRVWVQRSR